MKSIKLFLSLLSISISMIACSQQKKISGNYNYQTECMGVEGDGSQTLKAYGTGRNYFDASEQAKKNAVRDVIFKGIIEGRQECEKRPVLPEVNAAQKYEDYFNRFFADGGEYSKFVNLKDERIDRKLRERKGSREGVTQAVYVRVLRSELKQKLIQDGILK